MILHTGISMFSSADAAAARGGKYPSWIAEVKIPRDMAIHVAKTLGRGHYSVLAEPRVLAERAHDTGQRA